MAGDDNRSGPDAPGEEPRRFRLTFGIEKLGLVALRAPYVALALIVVLSALAVVGVSRLRVDDSLSELFRTDTREFRQYEQIDTRFPSSEYDVLVVVEGPDLLKREKLEAFRRAVVELQLADGINGVVSMLSARGKPDPSGYVAPVVPDDLPVGAAYDDMIRRLRTNEIVSGKFLSDDGTLALIVVALDRKVVEQMGPRTVIGTLQKAVEQEAVPAGLSVKLAGAPVMQLEIRNAVERDRLVYNGLGFLVGAGMAYLFFRRLSLTIIAVLGPSIAILWTLGVVGGLDFRLNLFINVITPLILVSGFSDSMHLVFAIRRDIMAGVDRLTAARNAVKDVAPACLLTAMNQAISIVSFAWADSALVRTFGIAALIAVSISYMAVAVVVPTLAAFLVRREAPTEKRGEAEEGGVGFLHRATARIVDHVTDRPLGYVLAGLAAVIVCGLAYSRLQAHYRLADQVPDREQALAATGRLDQKLTGANPVHVMIQFPAGQKLFDGDTMAVLAAAHKVLETEAGLGNVWSVDSLRRWLADAGDTRIETVKKYLDILPEHLVQRFLTKERDAVLATGRLPDVDASQILPVVDKLDKALDSVRKAYPGYEIAVTGLPAIAARNSAKLIWDMNWGLVGDIFLVFLFLGIALSSVLAGVGSILPSLLPIFATGALLYATGEGLQFASIIAITVAFSLAIDSTIHFLNRFRIEEDRLGGGPGTAKTALMATAHHIGPAVVLTTIVLALGLGVTILSHLPSLRLFGRLTGVCLFASLVAQLVVLPATIALYRRYVPRKG
ncbi:MAG: MMPL family transporter [Hyphomicrobiaceae bacterium]